MHVIDCGGPSASLSSVVGSACATGNGNVKTILLQSTAAAGCSISVFIPELLRWVWAGSN